MELREVTTFLVLTEELHFGRTAQRLRLSQGRVSQTIQALERELGGALFERSSRHVRLTRLGEEFRNGAERISEEVEATVQACRAVARGEGWRLHVGYTTSVGLGLVAELVRAFESAYPDSVVVFNSVGVRPANPIESLILGPGMDIALMWCPGGDGSTLGSRALTVGPAITQDPRAVLVPADHPLAGRDTLVLDDLVGYRLLEPGRRMEPALRDAWAPRFTPSGRRLEYTVEDLASVIGRPEVNITDVYPLVLAGRGLHFTVTSVLARVPCPGLVAVPVADLPAAALVPVWRAATDNDGIPAFAAVARSLRRPDD
ncbi:LysR family transcriptional regulator [Actinomycetes bacterium KLBMP 9759]